MDDLDSIINIDTEISGTGKPDYWRDIISSYTGNREKHFFLVAVRDGQIIGFIIGEIRAWEFGSAPCGWVFTIGVKPDNRLGRVGSELLDELCNLFHQAGMTKVRTMTSRQDYDVMSFFRSQGMMSGPYQQLEKEL